MTDLSIAEVIGNDKDEEELRKRALDELVETIMDGKKYPKNGHYICLHDILSDLDSVELSEIIRGCLFEDPIVGYCNLRDDVEELAKKRLNDSVWHHRMIEQLAEEDRD